MSDELREKAYQAHVGRCEEVGDLAFRGSFDAGWDAARASDQWIPVSEKLPENRSRVIMGFRNGETSFDAYFTDGEFWHGGDKYEPSHWQPLPTPQKEQAKI